MKLKQLYSKPHYIAAYSSHAGLARVMYGLKQKVNEVTHQGQCILLSS